ncbi:hypothetical protein [Corynebacterium appendicis]|uniref:hypothetical protein n=1 Tax=Corynebacterium appendicis TaxID=163202 RepID=UPI00254D403F|nr:hypothetical protein [Corynebacterium appendicis]MDK8625377.1 hypothetical protein [Corynebacterium appendicis]
MGVSRDLTAGNNAGGSTALLERAPQRTTRQAERTRTAPAPSGLKPRIAPHVPRGPRRLGSKQVVSVRGRRVTTTEAKRKFSTMSLMALPLLILGIFGAMLLSALSTQQTFTIEQLQSQERTLNNEIETLNRNVEDSRAAAEVAAKADAAGMVVPVQPGIIDVAADGKANETREADPEKNLRIVDVNEETIRTDKATSDRDATRDIADNLSALPSNSLPTGRGAAPSLPTPGSQSNGREAAPSAPAAPAAPAADAPAADTPEASAQEAPAGGALPALPGGF